MKKTILSMILVILLPMLCSGQSISSKTFTVNGVSFKMIYVEGGTFWMGAQCEDPNGRNYEEMEFSESPVHKVTLSDYSIGEFEVTQGLWEAVMGSNPSYFIGDPALPVESVNWDDIVNEFLPKLNDLLKEQRKNLQFVLPTEAQWEYAARGGNKSREFRYSGSDYAGLVAWSYENSGEETHIVGQKRPNELGLYDMSGNVWEWCNDWYGLYNSDAQTDPQGPSSSKLSHVLRGGSWLGNTLGCVVSRRLFDPTGGDRTADNGFRLALVPASR